MLEIHGSVRKVQDAQKPIKMGNLASRFVCTFSTYLVTTPNHGQIRLQHQVKEECPREGCEERSRREEETSRQEKGYSQEGHTAERISAVSQ